MTEPLLRTEPPSDRQLWFLAKLCKERGLPMPAPASFTEADLLIDEIKARRYDFRPGCDCRHCTGQCLCEPPTARPVVVERVISEPER